MRELKFRAWHKKYKRIYKVLHLHMESEQWVTAQGWSVPEDKPIHIRIQPKDCVIMQWTGMQDKDDKYIYDGDIISSGDYKNMVVCFGPFVAGKDDYQIDFPVVGWHVKFRDGGLYSLTSGPEGYTFDSAKCTIVGNIYENKELLTHAQIHHP